MNKLSLAAAIAFATAMMAPAAQAADGTIEFTGSVTSVTCTINGGTKDLSVILPAVASTSLSHAGATAGRTPFTIELTDCTAAGNVSTYFEAGDNVAANGHLNLDEGGAENVQVVLLNDTHGKIKVGAPVEDQNSQKVLVSGNAATLNYFAEYEASDAAVAGNVNTRVRFTIAYE